METKIGERLSKLRIDNNMTQEDFANKIGISRQSVSKWELDKSYPDLDKLVLIAQLFDVSTDYLLTGIEPENINEDDFGGCSGDKAFGETETAVIPKSLGPNKKYIGLHICRGLVGLVAVFMATLFCVLLSRNAWNIDENNKVYAQVEQVYDQYTKADVFFFDENNKRVQRTIWLDETGLRAGDFVLCYTNDTQDVILEDYNIDTLVVPGLITLILVGLFVLLSLEMKKNKE